MLLIGVFIETYLGLSAAEMNQYEREVATMTPDEQALTMQFETSWHRKGREEGILQGRHLP